MFAGLNLFVKKKGLKYGRFLNPEQSLSKRGITDAELVDSYILDMPAERMLRYFGRSKACSLMAIMNVVDYKLGGRSVTRRKDLKRYAKRWGYFDWRGTPFIVIPFILKGYAKRHGLRFKTKHTFILSWRDMVRNLRQNRPFLLNIAWGDYAKHTVTIIGYEVHESQAGCHRFLVTADSWADGIRYIDYDRLTGSKDFSIATAIYAKAE